MMNGHPTITALRATAPSVASPLPWSQTPHSMGIGVECASDDGNEFVGETFYAADARRALGLGGRQWLEAKC